MEKKLKLEDVIPEGTLKNILADYHKIRNIEDTRLRDFEKLVHQLVKVEEELQKIVDMGWLSEWVTGEMFRIIEDAALEHNKKGINFDQHCLKSELETTKSHFNLESGQKTVSRKTKGQPKLYAKSFLIATLAAEVKQNTGRANYKLLAEFLKPYYDIEESRLAIEIKRIRESQCLLHLVDIAIKYKLLQ